MAVRTPWNPEPGDVMTEARMDGFPRGWLGYAEVTANQGPITNEADLTGLSVTVTMDADRRIRITGGGTITTASGADPVGRIYAGGSAVGRWGQALDSGTGVEGMYMQGAAVITPSSGSLTCKLTLEDTSDLGVTLAAASGSPAFILVEDIGPAS